MIITTLILLIIVVSFLGFHHKSKAFIKQHEFIFGFYFTLIATVMGVFIGFYLSDQNSIKTEKKHVIELVNVAYKNVLSTIETNEDILKSYTEIKRSFRLEFIQDNPLSFPNRLEPILSNEKVSRNISITTYEDVYNTIEKANHIKTFFEKKGYKSNLAIGYHYNIVLKNIAEKLQSELQLLKHNITVAQKEEQFKAIDHKFDRAIAAVYATQKKKLTKQNEHE